MRQIALETYKNGQNIPSGVKVLHVRRVFENSRTRESFIDVVVEYDEPEVNADG